MNIKSRQFNTIIPGRPNSIATDGDIHFALRLWKKQLKDNLIIADCYDRKFFQTPSSVKRKKMDSAKYKQKKESER